MEKKRTTSIFIVEEKRWCSNFVSSFFHFLFCVFFLNYETSRKLSLEKSSDIKKKSRWPLKNLETGTPSLNKYSPVRANFFCLVKTRRLIYRYIYLKISWDVHSCVLFWKCDFFMRPFNAFQRWPKSESSKLNTLKMRSSSLF